MLVRIAAATVVILASGLAAKADNLSSGQEMQRENEWAGPYAGVTGGAIGSTGEARRGDFDGALLTLDVQNGLFPSSIDETDVTRIAGVTLGYNVQRGVIVGGLELDHSFTGLDAVAGFSRTDPNPDPVFNGVQTITGYGTTLDSLATVRLRAGRIFGSSLVYVTGGLAMGQVENSFTLELPELNYSSPNWREDGDRYGYAVGAGIERRLSDRVSFKAEVMYYDLDDAIVEAQDASSFPGQSIDYRFDNAGMLGRVGINVRF